MNFDWILVDLAVVVVLLACLFCRVEDVGLDHLRLVVLVIAVAGTSVDNYEL